MSESSGQDDRVPEPNEPESTESQSTESQSAASKPAGSKPAESRSSRPAKPKPTKPKPAKEATPERSERRRAIIRFAIFLVVGAILTVLLYFLLSALIPRWWSQLIGRQVSGRISNGILRGLIYGFVFTFLPLIVLAQARHRAFSWPAKGIIVLIAAALTAPNLMTLGIAVGTTPAAQAGDRTMDVTAPGFRYASLWGVVFGVLAAVVVVTASILWERRGEELKILRARVEALEKELPPALPLPQERVDPPKPTS